MKSKINRIQNVIGIILCVFLIIYFIFLERFTLSDELWNFQNILKMCNGLTIYKDANVIITPIFFYIGYFLLKIFGTNMIVFRIYNLIIYIGILFIIYKILKNLNISKHLRIIFEVLIFLFMFSLVTVGANYNMLAVCWILLGINLYITKKSNNINQGILISIIFLTKQNIGVLYAIAIILYELYLNKFSKKFILDQFKKFFFFLIPTLVVCLQMVIKGNFFYFINYAFGGLFNFGEKNLIISIFEYFYIFPIAETILYFYTINKKSIFNKFFMQEKKDNLTLLYIFAIIMMFCIIPIMNTAHFMYTLPFHILFLFYFFDVIILEEIIEDKYINNIRWFAIILLIIFVIRVIISLIVYKDVVIFIKDKNSCFFGINVQYALDGRAKVLEKYIISQNEKGIDVIIASSEAAYSMIELKQSHGEYDLLFNGNMGYNGIERVKEDISSRKNTEFLIFTDEKDMFWQESKEIREFIQKNLTKKGEILNYTIYSTEK